jgi:hypothetical protein
MPEKHKGKDEGIKVEKRHVEGNFPVLEVTSRQDLVNCLHDPAIQRQIRRYGGLLVVAAPDQDI